MTSINSKLKLEEIRCKQCNKLLAKENMKGVLEIKCARCGSVNVIVK